MSNETAYAAWDLDFSKYIKNPILNFSITPNKKYLPTDFIMDSKSIRNWLQTKTTGKYAICFDQIHFEKHNDAVEFKLQFG